MIKVKVKIHEFTYFDKGRHHTIVSQGEVPESNSEIKKALHNGILEPINKKTATRKTDPK